jgi:hypothetical protein
MVDLKLTQRTLRNLLNYSEHNEIYKSGLVQNRKLGPISYRANRQKFLYTGEQQIPPFLLLTLRRLLSLWYEQGRAHRLSKRFSLRRLDTLGFGLLVTLLEYKSVKLNFAQILTRTLPCTTRSQSKKQSTKTRTKCSFSNKYKFPKFTESQSKCSTWYHPKKLIQKY